MAHSASDLFCLFTVSLKQPLPVKKSMQVCSWLWLVSQSSMASKKVISYLLVIPKWSKWFLSLHLLLVLVKKRLWGQVSGLPESCCWASLTACTSALDYACLASWINTGKRPKTTLLCQIKSAFLHLRQKKNNLQSRHIASYFWWMEFVVVCNTNVILYKCRKRQMCLYSEVQENSNMKKNKKEHTKKALPCEQKKKKKSNKLALTTVYMPVSFQTCCKFIKKRLRKCCRMRVQLHDPILKELKKIISGFRLKCKEWKKQGVSCRTWKAQIVGD